MKKLSLLLACALLCGTATLAAAACSPEEAQKKANEFATAIQKKAQARLCQFYDAALEKLN